MPDNLLLLHGALGSKRQMEDLALLLEPSFHVVCHNLPGHGGRPLPTEYTMHQFVEDTADFIRKKLNGHTHIFGYSMGGYVALRLAMIYPELADRIIVLGTKFDWTPETAEREALLLNPDKMVIKVPSFTTLLSHRHAPQNWKDVVNLTRYLLMRLGNGEAFIMSAFKLSQEVLILRGAMDHMVTEAETVYMSEILENGRYEIIPGFRHAIEQVDQQLLAAKIKSSLE